MENEDSTREKAAALLEQCRGELGRRVVGQREMLDGLLSALVAGGHVLLEGVPGLAKTRAVKSLAELTGLEFKRIQFTPDLLPADLTGTLVWEQKEASFSVRKGPVFANLILADEINRAPAKVQSALLEAMEEGQVTIGEESYALPDPFFVLATQNPIEHEGTYALPEAELDRFFLKLRVKYPSPDEELTILKFAGPGASGGEGPLRALLDRPALAFLRGAAASVHIDEQVKRYIVSVVSATRPPATRGSPEDAKKLARQDVYRHISFGASPRASLALYRYARVSALFQGRSFVTPAEVKAAALPVLRHRVVLSYEAEADGLDADGVISRILASVPVP
ncbi:MAG: MoxR family ATPase [Spirochaetaceae bacterium]|jgi:MoxR-like ATPase|nr:MoxR family ATPase [Spirochaetaceae bacterium]